MKNLLIGLLGLGMLTLALAQEKNIDCDNPQTQGDINYCAGKKLESAVKDLSAAVLKKCAYDPDVASWEGGSAYPGILADCQAEIYIRLKKEI